MGDLKAEREVSGSIRLRKLVAGISFLLLLVLTAGTGQAVPTRTGHSLTGATVLTKIYGPDTSGQYGGSQGKGWLLGVNSAGIIDHTRHVSFRGRAADVGGHVYMGARYYDANTRTFLSADPLDYNAGINLYSYAAGDPVNFTDPDGRIAKGVGSGWSGGLSSSSPTSASFNMGMSLGGTVSGAVSGLWSGGSDLVMGEYSTAPATWGRTLGQLGVGLTPVGIAADIRDWSKSAADLRNGSGSWAQMAVSTVFLFPGASELGKVGKLGNGLIGITPQGGRAIGAARGIPDPYTGIRQASQYLQEMGVSRADRVRYLQSFEPQNMVVRQAGQSEFGLRFFSDPARAGGQYLFETFPASRASLAIKPEWSTMAGFRQFQIRPGATLLEGRAAAQGPFLQGGQTQKFILDSRADLIAP